MTGVQTCALPILSTLTGVTDSVGNTLASTYSAGQSYDLDRTNPATTIGFPAAVAYNTAGWNAGCSTTGLCGSASDGSTWSDTGIARVQVAIQNVTTNRYWNGSSWAVGITWLTATGTTSWAYGFAASNLVNGSQYTVSARATDGVGNVEAPAVTSSFIYDTEIGRAHV